MGSAQLSSGSKIVVTLGTGFATLLLEIVAMNHSKYNYSYYNYYDGFLFMSTVMLIQQGARFWQTKCTTLVFTTILFGSSFYVTAMELHKINRNPIS